MRSVTSLTRSCAAHASGAVQHPIKAVIGGSNRRTVALAQLQAVGVEGVAHQALRRGNALGRRVYAHDLTVRPHGLRQPERVQANAAPDVQPA
jgi:hypothetical protein